MARTSSHPTGVDAVGRSVARSEYTHTVVFFASFWLQSISTLPVRCAFVIRETTRSGSAASSVSATAFANGFVRSYVTAPEFSGTYTCSPFEPDVFAKLSRPSCSNMPCSCRPT